MVGITPLTAKPRSMDNTPTAIAVITLALRMKRLHRLFANAAIDAAAAKAGKVDNPNKAITKAPAGADPVAAAVICIA